MYNSATTQYQLVLGLMFKSDVHSVRLSRGYSYADAVHHTGRLLCQWYADQSSDIHESVVLSNDRRHKWVTVAKCPRSSSHRIEIRTVWWPVLRPDEVRRLGRQQCNRLESTVSWGIVLLKYEERSRYITMLPQLHVMVIQTIYLHNRSIKIIVVKFGLYELYFWLEL